jgi:phosphomannomutase
VLLEKYGDDAKKYGVLIAHDNRRKRFLFTETAAGVLGAMGIPTTFFKDNELQPTPLVSFTIINNDFIGGAIVTASHNPPSDNGFKVYDHDGTQLLPT